MAEEFYTQAFALGRSFDNSRNIGDYVAVKVSKVRVKGCKGIVSDFGIGMCKSI